MKTVQLTPNWKLENLSGTWRLRKKGSRHRLGPEDIVSIYPAWQPQAARVQVKRVANQLKNREVQLAAYEFGLVPPENFHPLKTTTVQLRIDPEKKATYQQAAQAAGLKLSAWITRACDQAAKQK